MCNTVKASKSNFRSFFFVSNKDDIDKIMLLPSIAHTRTQAFFFVMSFDEDD